MTHSLSQSVSLVQLSDKSQTQQVITDQGSLFQTFVGQKQQPEQCKIGYLTLVENEDGSGRKLVYNQVSINKPYQKLV